MKARENVFSDKNKNSLKIVQNSQVQNDMCKFNWIGTSN